MHKGKGVGLFALLCGAVLVGGALTTAPETVSTLRFATLGMVHLPSRAVFLLCGLMSLVTGALYIRAAPRPGWQAATLSLGALVLVWSILVWASMGRRLEVLGILLQSVRLATPIALGALAGLLSERSGIVNIAIEGMMLTAACVGFTAALYGQNIWVGVLAAMAAGGFVAALHAALSIHGRVDQIISGTALNLLAVGLTGFIRRILLVQHPHAAPAVLPLWPLPWLSDIPVLGPLLFRHQPLVYATVALVLAIHVLLFYTRWGLRTRAIGEHPQAADTLGVRVLRLRYQNVIAGGMIAGLGGAWFSLETVGTFDDMMTGGKGFIALAAMIFGQWTPLGAWGGALLFGFADALQIKLQIAGVHVPHQLLGMIPYLVTMVALAGLIGRARPPAAAGLPYVSRT